MTNDVEIRIVGQSPHMETGEDVPQAKCESCGYIGDKTEFEQTEGANSENAQSGHDKVEELDKEQFDWPRFYVAGETVDSEDFVPAYYRVEGPNGPVSYLNPGQNNPVPTTMHSFAMEAQSDDFRYVPKEKTPFASEQ